MSFSPVVQVRKLIDKIKSERSSPRLKRFPSRTLSEEARDSSSSSFNIPPYKHRKSGKQEQEITGPNHFEFIPLEASLYILSYLDAKSLGRLAQTSSSIHILADDEMIWKELTMFEFGIISALETMSWKQSYIYLENLFTPGTWEGMSKWIEPAGYENEQKTNAKLQFVKRSHRSVSSSSPISRDSPKAIHRVDSQSQTTVVPKTTDAASTTRPGVVAPKNHRDAPYRIIGDGITVNDNQPCSFKIEGSRMIDQSTTGCMFEWNKQFEKHTSIYFGKMDYAARTVTGTISYQEGGVHWKGIFSYTKSLKQRSKLIGA